MFIWENRKKKPVSISVFAQRMMNWLMITSILSAISLGIGMFGYHFFENMSWLDAFYNASMIFGGMGEIDVLHTKGGKIFAGLYAIYSGFFLVICGGLLMAPIFHRIIHFFHADQ